MLSDPVSFAAPAAVRWAFSQAAHLPAAGAAKAAGADRLWPDTAPGTAASDARKSSRASAASKCSPFAPRVAYRMRRASNRLRSIRMLPEAYLPCVSSIMLAKPGTVLAAITQQLIHACSSAAGGAARMGGRTATAETGQTPARSSTPRSGSGSAASAARRCATAADPQLSAARCRSDGLTALNSASMVQRRGTAIPAQLAWL